MKPDILEILTCPHCLEHFDVEVEASSAAEIRSGRITCRGEKHHQFAIKDGILGFCTAFDHEAVQREIAYENTTYAGDERLRDPVTIAGFPDTLAQLWPHTRYFGPDFQDMLSQFTFMPSDWALDIGTASCWTSRLLAQTGVRTIALDVNDANYYGLRTADLLFEHHGVYFERVLESMTCLPFGDATISYVFFNASLHHTPDLSRTLAECYRVLRPGGTVAMVNEALVSWRHRLFPSREEPTDTGSHHEISYAKFDAACRAAGFSVHYGITSHVKEKLKDRLTEKPARFACRVLESIPWLQNQLKSSQIILTKPEQAAAFSATFANRGVKPEPLPFGQAPGQVCTRPRA